MKALLQLSILFVAFAMSGAHGRSIVAAPAAGAQSTTTAVVSSAQFPEPAAPVPPELSKQGDPVLPVKGSPLPLVSLIGFGLLVGGILPAMRARKITRTHS
jgi:hypothetical protein